MAQLTKHTINRFIAISLSILFAWMAGAMANAQNAQAWKQLKGDLNLYMCNDLGRNGYYQQKPIAELMGTMAETIDPEAVLAVGDIHHFNGVASVNDPLWTTNYETVYSHPELMLDWFATLGNHEYRGNTQAVLDYRQVSRRWVMPARYYTRVFEDDGVAVRVVFIDTTPMIARYRAAAETYPDVQQQDVKQQIEWIDQTLKTAKEDWVVVVGHHPVYAQSPKSESERTDLQQLLMPVLKRYNNVAIYASGHIHNFQHIKPKGDNIDYVVNSSASLARKVEPMDGTVFCSPSAGFSVIAATKTELKLHMIDAEGRAIHTVTKTK